MTSDVVARISLANVTRKISFRGNRSSTSDTYNGYIPVMKGDKYTIVYSGTGSNVTFRFIYAKGNGSLYFYVGETVQNANLIDAGRIGEQLANKVDINFNNMNPSQTSKNTIVGWGMPDYDAGVEVSYPYTAEYKCIANIRTASSGNDAIKINNKEIGLIVSGTNTVTCELDVGDVLNVTGSAQAYVYIFPLKGVN